MSIVFSEHFNLGNTATKLNNGDFMIWYGRRNGDEKECFQIIRVEDSKCILRKQEVIVSEGTTVRSYLECSALLTDNNVVVVYIISPNVYFAIYDESGNVIKSAADTGIDVTFSRGMAVAVLTGGGFCICFSQGANGGYFVIYDNSGTVTTSAIQFQSSGVTMYDVSITPLNNGNFFIAYNMGATGNGYFVIYDANGVEIVEPTVFNSVTTERFETTATLSNGNVVLAFLSDDKQYLMIYDEDGNVVKAKTEYSDDSSNDICAKAASDGGFYIAYGNSVDASIPGTLIKFSSSGTIESTTTFKDANVHLISIAGETGDDVLIAYRNADNSNYGELNLGQLSGEELDWLSGEGFAPPYDIITYKRLVAAAADTIWYEDI